MNKTLAALISLAATWPLKAQDELAVVARQIELEHSGKVYRLSASERSAISEGMAQADRGEFVPDAEMEAFFARNEP